MAHYHRKRRSSKKRKSSAAEFLLLLVGLPLAGVILYFNHDPASLMTWFLVAAAIIALLIGVISFFLWRKRYQQRRALQLSNVDRMHGLEFEEYLRHLLSAQGYEKVAVTPSQGDFGADLIAYKDGRKYAVQAKRSRGLIGVDAIYQVLGGKAEYDAQETMVVTNSFFSSAAQSLASKSGTTLIHRKILTQWILDWQQQANQ